MTSTPHPVILVVRGSRTVSVRWFRTAEEAEAYAQVRPGIIADQTGVMVSGYLHEVPARWIEHAQLVHAKLAADPDADLSNLATHALDRHSGQVIPLAEGAGAA